MISLTETWLHQSNLDSDIKFQGYKSPVRHDRQADAHGGVAVYVKGMFHSRQRNDLELRNVECVWVEILIKNKPVLIGTFYRPPNSNALVLSDIETSIDLAHDTGIKDIIITGDFNLDLLKQNTRKKIDDICNSTVHYN